MAAIPSLAMPTLATASPDGLARLSHDLLARHRDLALAASRKGPPAPPSNPYFGVGPISDGAANAAEHQGARAEFEIWLGARYRRRDAEGRDLGPYSAADFARSMHRGEPADTVLRDMMRSVHRYFGLGAQNRLAVGLGGGHSGFTVCIQHLLAPRDPAQHVFIDTAHPEAPGETGAGFFRRSWAAQIHELCAHAGGGALERLHFAQAEGRIPPAAQLEAMGIRLFVGVGHETTGATSYPEADIRHLLDWLEAAPHERHAILDATSLLGAMPWSAETIRAVMEKCCLFMPLQKAIGGVAGYFLASFPPQSLAQIDRNLQNLAWAIPRQLSLAVPSDPARPLTSPKTTAGGPFYDPQSDRMTGGVINTYSLLAFAETSFALERLQARIGPCQVLNARALHNRALTAQWLAGQDLLAFAVADPALRGAAVTLLQVRDPDMAPLHGQILAAAKQLLGHEGLIHANGQHEPGLCAAYYVNAFPGIAGDFRAWLGGIRPPEDVAALLENLAYAWQRAKLVVLERELALAAR